MLEIAADLGYPHSTVLPDLRLQVGAGQAVVLVGRNGCGKTTLLRTAAGLLHPRDGHVLVMGRPAADQASRVHVGLVPDPPPLYEELSPWEHLELVQRLWGGRVPDSALDEMVEHLGLEDFLSQRCDSLSLGTRKRVGVALALLHRPELLLLDEPFNGLDAVTTDVLRGLLAAHVAAGGSVLASTHQPGLLADIATRGLLLQDGRIAYDGDAAGLPPPGSDPVGAPDPARPLVGRPESRG